MKTPPRITLRFGASHNEAVIDGTKIDLAPLTHGQRKMVRGVVIGAFKQTGYFS